MVQQQYVSYQPVPEPVKMSYQPVQQPQMMTVQQPVQQPQMMTYQTVSEPRYMGAPTSPRVSMPMPGTIGVDINRDGIPDFRLAPGQTAGVDVNHDGITDYTVRNATP